MSHPRPFGSIENRWRIVTSFSLWGATYVGVRLLLDTPVAGGWRAALALVPLPFFLWLLVELIRALRVMDELERRIQLEALAVAFPLSLVLFMTLALLEIAIPLDPANWSYRHIWPFLTIFYAAGLTIARRRYQ